MPLIFILLQFRPRCLKVDTLLLPRGRYRGELMSSIVSNADELIAKVDKVIILLSDIIALQVLL